MKRLSPLLTKSESLIRRGEVAHATELLRSLDPAKVSLRYCVPLANLMRRCGMFESAIRLTQRALRRSKPGDKMHTTAMAEYCTVLIRLGSVDEAGKKLSTVSTSAEPSVLIAQFWYHFTRYEYPESIPVLERWLQSLDDPYLKMIAEINLAEAHFGAGNFTTSRSIVTKAIEKCQVSGYLRLLANALHIRARCFQELDDLKSSYQDLDRAHQILKSSVTGDVSLLSRQRAINEAFEKNSLAPISKFRISALRAGLWESLRELDFQSLRIHFRSEVMQKLYYGTPYPAYRTRILSMFPNQLLKTEYVWGPRQAPTLHLGTGEITKRTKDWQGPTPQIKASLLALLKDQYRPLSTRELHAELFPHLEFESEQSDDRVHQCIARLRKWLREQSLPLKVERQRGGYSLKHVSRPAIALCIPERTPKQFHPRATDDFIQALQDSFGSSKLFSAHEVRQCLSLSSATTVRRLTSAVKMGKLNRTGSGKRTRYQIVH